MWPCPEPGAGGRAEQSPLGPDQLAVTGSEHPAAAGNQAQIREPSLRGVCHIQVGCTVTSDPMTSAQTSRPPERCPAQWTGVSQPTLVIAAAPPRASGLCPLQGNLTLRLLER